MFISGLGATLAAFNKFAPMLIGRYHVYGVTRRGYPSLESRDSSAAKFFKLPMIYQMENTSSSSEVAPCLYKNKAGIGSGAAYKTRNPRCTHKRVR
jgi:hypothetical protein